MEASYTHLSVEERAVIQVSLAEGHSVRAIARTLARSPATISRELARNGWQNPRTRARRRGRRPIAGGYRAQAAERRAQRLRRLPRRRAKLTPDTPLWSDVTALLQAGHSPEQISAMRGRMHPDDNHARVSIVALRTPICRGMIC